MDALLRKTASIFHIISNQVPAVTIPAFFSPNTMFIITGLLRQVWPVFCLPGDENQCCRGFDIESTDGEKKRKK